MKKTDQSKLKKMWQDPKGKAILKFGIYGIFFLLMIFVILLMNVFTSYEKQYEKTPQTQEETITFLPFEQMWEKLSLNCKYYYEVKKIENQEQIIYQGEIKDQIDTGYRESKLGIIHYKVENEKTMQIILDTEEEIDNLYEEPDEQFLNLKNLETFINTIHYSEKDSGKLKTRTIETNDKKITIHMSPTDITSIQITTQEKEYRLHFS